MRFSRLRPIRLFTSALVASAMLLASAPATALSMNEEIERLLNIIAASPCAFIRNGVSYGGAQAAAHIRSKYEHYRSEIRSTEDFVTLAATKSVLSGRPYLVQCDTSVIPAAEWLKSELAAVRQTS